MSKYVFFLLTVVSTLLGIAASSPFIHSATPVIKASGFGVVPLRPDDRPRMSVLSTTAADSEVFNRLPGVMKVVPHCYSGRQCILRTFLEWEAENIICVDQAEENTACIRAQAAYAEKLSQPMDPSTDSNPTSQAFKDLQHDLYMHTEKFRAASVCATGDVIAIISRMDDVHRAVSAFCEAILRDTDNIKDKMLLRMSCVLLMLN